MKKTVLNEKEWIEFNRILDNPREPTPELIKLMQSYMEGVASGRIITDTTSTEEAKLWLEREGKKNV